VKEYTLLELNLLVRNTLDSNLEPSYWVIAEIGDIRINQKGHCYLELVQNEGDEIVAKSRATIWSSTYQNLKPFFESITGQPLKQGLKVMVNVGVQFHELYGFSLNIRDIDPRFTLGEKARIRQETIKRLVEEGLYDLNKSKFLAIVPQNLAVISSPTAAGYGDFINHLANNPNGYQFSYKLFKALMQGNEAEESIIQAIERIKINIQDFDALVIIRGGGSQVDLDCFDSYNLTSKIASMSIPVITGIGHERDETISDLVAHTSLKTPTAVSDFLINAIVQFESSLDQWLSRIKVKSEKRIHSEQLMLSGQYHLLKQFAIAIVQRESHRLIEKQKQLEPPPQIITSASKS